MNPAAAAPPPASTERYGQRGERRFRRRSASSLEIVAPPAPTSPRSDGTTLGIDPLDAHLRQVYFFDTPDLALNAAGVVARARRTQQKPDDSVVKLRPVIPSELPEEVRDRKDFVVELDALPGGHVCSGSFTGELGTGAVSAAVSGEFFSRELTHLATEPV